MSVAKGTHRFIYAAVAFIALLLGGLIYAWSLFIEPLEAEFGWTRAQTSLIFTLSLITFSIGMIIAGFLDKRGWARKTMFATAFVAAFGFIASAFTTSLLWIYFTYGILVGLAAGLSTDAVMAIALRWYPDKQGFASGAMLMGFGIGAMVLSPFVTMMLNNMSWRTAFIILGIVFGVAFFVIAIILKEPPEEIASALKKEAQENDIVASRDYPAIEMVKTGSFWMFILWLILVSSAGLGLISQAVPAAQDVLAKANVDAAAATALATAAMSSISLFNGLGRFFNGFVWDKWGYRASLLWISVGYILSMLLCGVATAIGSFPLIVAGFVILGFMYGGNMCAMAAMCSSFFGAKYFSMNYAVSTCQIIVSASLGPLLLATLQGQSGSYQTAFWVFLALGVVSLVLSFFVRKPKEN